MRVPLWAKGLGQRSIRSVALVTVLYGITPFATQTLRAQTPPPAARCRTGESGSQCFRRALDVAEVAFANESAPRRATTTTGQSQRRLQGDALSLLLDACRLKEAEACFFAGTVVATPDSGGTDASIEAKLNDAFKLFREGCDAPSNPSAGACNGLGEAYQFGYGTGGQPSFDSAYVAYRRGCALGSPTACAYQGRLSDGRAELGTGSMAAGMSLVEKGCRGGSPYGCSSIFYFFQDSLRRVPASLRNTPQFRADVKKANTGVRVACNAGLWVACNNVGATFDSPLFRQPNIDSALFYYRGACDAVSVVLPGIGTVSLGEGWSCKNLGERAADAELPDTSKAMAYLEQGCRLLESEACVRLASVGYASHTLPPHLALLRAVEACDEQYARGCSQASWFLTQNELQDVAAAIRFGGQACDANIGWGCNNAGIAAAKSDRVAVAIKYYRRGCDLQYVYGCSNLGHLLNSTLQFSAGARVYLERACDLLSSASVADQVNLADACWQAAQFAAKRGDGVNEGRYRSLACSYDKARVPRDEVAERVEGFSHCKRK